MGEGSKNESAVLEVRELGFQWETADPFLFCVHHRDFYPSGNERLGPAASLAGRSIGNDFEGKDGWRMYHGDVVPGFPEHPHRGFETVTVVQRGFVDHADSLGACGRYGGGDVQWMTAGGGIQHSEMFPLLDSGGPNTLELFQIWLNLPKAGKLVQPYFKMLWREDIPTVEGRESPGVRVRLVAGAYDDKSPPSPPPDSWAAHPEAEVAIWIVDLDEGARWNLPPASQGVNRTLYFFQGEGLRVDGRAVGPYRAIRLRGHREIEVESAGHPGRLLLLQGRPIGEPVAQYGPFVMNTHAEIHQAFADYQETRFGGWSWDARDPVHGAQQGRFARHPDGRGETPGS